MFEDVNDSLLKQFAPELDQLNLNDWYKDNKFKRTPLSAALKEERRGSNLAPESKFQDLPYNIDRNLKGTHESISSQKANDIKAKQFSSPIKFEYEGNSLKAPFTDNRRKIQKTSAWDKIKKSYTDYVGKVASKLPDADEDRLRATFNGIEVRHTPLSNITKHLGMSEYQGYNRITGGTFNITGTAGMSDKEYEYWKQMQREETSKYVRQRGASIDPFAREPVSEYSREVEHYNALKRTDTSGMSGMEKAKHRSTVNEARSRVDSMSPAGHQIRDREQLADIKKRLETSKNDFKTFFNPVDKKEMDMLQSAHDRLEERIRRYDGHYTSDLIHNYDIGKPPSVSESFKDLYERRASLESSLNEKKAGPKSIYNEKSISLLSSQISDVNNEIGVRAKQQGFGNNFKMSDPHSLGFPSYTKDYEPTYGTSGYGLGFKNSMAASRTEHLARFGHYLNPFGAGGASGTQALMETMGFMNKQQKVMASQARGLSRLVHNMVPIAAGGLMFSSMADGKGPGEIVEDFVSMGGALHGWRTGSALGGALNIGQKTKFIGLGIGGIAGAATGYLLGAAAVGGINDIMSNDSKIRSFAKKMGTKESIVTMPETRQSLTARQASLQKLAKSGLNDRGTLLGNESSVLAGII